MKKALYLLLFFILCVVRTYSQDTLDSPILVKPPPEKDVVIITPELEWMPVANASQYDIQVSTDPSFQSKVMLQQPSVTSNIVVIEQGALQPFTKYYWRVKAKNALTYSEFSPAFNFRTAGTPVQELNFLKTYIVGLVSNNQLNQFKANELLEKLNQAIDKINANNNFGAITKIFQFIFKVANFIQNGDLSLVYGQKMTDNSSSVVQFLNGDNSGTGGNENIFADKFSLQQNYPNPFNPTTVIGYSIPDDGNVTLKIYNLLGEEVVTLVDKYQEKGTYSVVWDATEMSSGIYIYKVITANNVEAKKMILQK